MNVQFTIIEKDSVFYFVEPKNEVHFQKCTSKHQRAVEAMMIIGHNGKVIKSMFCGIPKTSKRMGKFLFKS